MRQERGQDLLRTLLKLYQNFQACQPSKELRDIQESSLAAHQAGSLLLWVLDDSPWQGVLFGSP